MNGRSLQTRSIHHIESIASKSFKATSTGSPLLARDLREATGDNAPSASLEATDEAAEMESGTNTDRRLEEVEKHLAEMQVEENKDLVKAASLREGIAKRKTALESLHKLLQHCKAMGIEVEEIANIDQEVGLVEQAERVVRGGYAAIARAALAEVDQRAAPTHSS
ncbi:hypothetical protein PRZ48_014033 [Zasmidium cellare]|uniref:Uncharacterized protein n=1 Tax=Zasmidium cellare TaxID=395010 RepID=A0ABR0DZS3_ZASCE|nr:hypothetical protein PRZ48_014033 [Zasmidium cellare]